MPRFTVKFGFLWSRSVECTLFCKLSHRLYFLVSANTVLLICLLLSLSPFSSFPPFLSLSYTDTWSSDIAQGDLVIPLPQPPERCGHSCTTKAQHHCTLKNLCGNSIILSTNPLGILQCDFSLWPDLNSSRRFYSIAYPGLCISYSTFCLNITDGGTAVALSLESHRLSEDIVPFDHLCLLKGRTLFPHPIKMPSLLLYLPIRNKKSKDIFVMVGFKDSSFISCFVIYGALLGGPAALLFFSQ